MAISAIPEAIVTGTGEETIDETLGRTTGKRKTGPRYHRVQECPGSVLLLPGAEPPQLDH